MVAALKKTKTICETNLRKHTVSLLQMRWFPQTRLLQAGWLGGHVPPPPVFGRSVNPISTRGAHSPHPVLRAPSDFETLRRP